VNNIICRKDDVKMIIFDETEDGDAYITLELMDGRIITMTGINEEFVRYYAEYFEDGE
jgi:hypothetical protein